MTNVDLAGYSDVPEAGARPSAPAIRTVIAGEPCSQGRPRFARRGQHVVAYDPAKSRSWKALARFFFCNAMQDHGRAIGIPSGAPCLVGPVEVHILAVFTCPKSAHRKMPVPRRPHGKRPDAENVAKATLDAATGVLWFDDAQVARLTVEKVIGAQLEAPYVEVTVRPLQGEP